jgi:hypothetical protein
MGPAGARQRRVERFLHSDPAPRGNAPAEIEERNADR